MTFSAYLRRTNGSISIEEGLIGNDRFPVSRISMAPLTAYKACGIVNYLTNLLIKYIIFNSDACITKVWSLLSERGIDYELIIHTH